MTVVAEQTTDLAAQALQRSRLHIQEVMRWLEVTCNIDPRCTDAYVELVFVWHVELQHTTDAAGLERWFHWNASKLHDHLPSVHCDMQRLMPKPSSTE
jgi:hypothetical protein